MDDRPHSAFFGEGRVVQQLDRKLLQLHKDILSPRESLEVLERLVVLGVEALLHRLIHGCDFFLVVLQELILEGFLDKMEST